ncbi:MAG: thiamine pyrophosphate-dependent enzyme [Bdellovibrionales bacterium]
MNQFEATKFIHSKLTNEIVVSALGVTSYILYECGDRSENFYLWGTMGLPVSVGLGMSLQNKSRTVVALEGDGGILMNLGALATVGWTSPPNLRVVILDNRCYATTGGQPTATSARADLAKAARALGIENTSYVENLEDLRLAWEKPHGPQVIVARVDVYTPKSKLPIFDPTLIKNRLLNLAGR